MDNDLIETTIEHNSPPIYPGYVPPNSASSSYGGLHDRAEPCKLAECIPYGGFPA
jgi:hypothetical protein